MPPNGYRTYHNTRNYGVLRFRCSKNYTIPKLNLKIFKIKLKFKRVTFRKRQRQP